MSSIDRIARALLVGCLMVLAIPACGASSGPVQPAGSATVVTSRAERPHQVAVTTLTLVDRSRPTEPGSQSPGSPERTLDTTLYVPDVPVGTRLPLIVFSHGLFGHPDKFTKLLSVWAAAGYVVAAPAFPLTNSTVPGALANWTGLANQPGDVSFVIDELLRLDREEGSAVFQRIDSERIGAAGLSLGGATTYAVVFNDCCRDDRIHSAQVLAGARLAVGGEYELDGHVPLLIVHGDADASLPYAMAVDAFGAAASPVWFVTLVGGSHAPPFEDEQTPYDAAVERLTTDFWDATLGGDESAWSRFERDANVEGLVTLQRKVDVEVSELDDRRGVEDGE